MWNRHSRPGLTLVVLVAAACENAPDRRLELPVPGPGPSPPPAVVILEGPTSIAPGSSAQFRAVIAGGFGPSRDITGEADWTVQGTGLVVSQTGLVTAHHPGFATVTAVVRTLRGELGVAAVPPGTFAIRGSVTPTVTGAPARVRVLDGPQAGTIVEADAAGRYVLAGVAGALRLRASLLGHADQERAVAASEHLVVDFALESPATGDPAGSWRIAISTSAGCPFQVRDAAAVLTLGRDAGSASGLWARPRDRAQDFFSGSIVGAAVSLTLRYYDMSDFEYGLNLAPPPVEVIGQALGVVAGERITGTVNGTYVDRSSEPPRACVATDHAFVMTRE